MDITNKMNEVMKDIKIADYVYSSINYYVYMAYFAHLVEAWEVDRGADGAENVFDLEDFKDFHLFANLYGVEEALSCQGINRFWFGGTNYMPDSIGTGHTSFEEFPPSICEAKALVNSLIGVDEVLARPDIYSKYIDTDQLMKDCMKKEVLELETNDAVDLLYFINNVISQTHTGETRVMIETPEDLSDLCEFELRPLTYAWYDELNDIIRISFE